MISIKNEIELVCVIVNYGLSKKIEKLARQNGSKYTSCVIAKGTSSTGIMDLMGLSDTRKEIVYLIMESEKIDSFLNELDFKYKFYKANHGIAFAISVSNLIGCHYNYYNGKSLEGKNMNDLITAIVDKGKAEDVVAAASKGGAKGGTIINARGSASDSPCQKIFAVEIEPEKEIVIIISESDKTDSIVESINKEMNLEKPNSGILFVQPVKRTLGIQK
ncbi:P-II family nitrogen regulator [Peptostreptococcus sp. D1]|uniref:P-II family nitrogen regulator n=1 Tax=Peptostreptococcus sp. D1 TaxID=72304 RepID=UPI0008ED1F69|nr:P-II family nitrogen regulator [Peptostreptococcus sp. D1]SFE23751.1 nitrogen regulatory protein P-II family [Peptostreptococcus sp. D1]